MHVTLTNYTSISDTVNTIEIANLTFNSCYDKILINNLNECMTDLFAYDSPHSAG